MIVLPNKVFNFAVSKQFRSGDNTVNSAKDYEKAKHYFKRKCSHKSSKSGSRKGKERSIFL